MRSTWFVGGAVAIAAVALLIVLFAGSEGTDRGHRAATAALTMPEHTATAALPSELPTTPSELAADIIRAQRIIDGPSSAGPQLAAAGLLEQLATGALERQTRQGRSGVLAILQPQAAATMRTNLRAASALSGLTTPERHLPPWTIIRPPPPNTLLTYFKAAQSQSGIPWQYLAAIELIETRFGRIRGPSTAGAQGPMQFLRESWALYGRGSIYDQRDAISAAARLLLASGAPAHMANALYHYNPSVDYVRAVQAYASRMHADPRAYYGYYYWQVLFDWARGLVILPVGYPAARLVPVR
jgi:hypothetical protein